MISGARRPEDVAEAFGVLGNSNVSSVSIWRTGNTLHESDLSDRFELWAHWPFRSDDGQFTVGLWPTETQLNGVGFCASPRGNARSSRRDIRSSLQRRTSKLGSPRHTST